jgi:hypothetical protein
LKVGTCFIVGSIEGVFDGVDVGNELGKIKGLPDGF